MFIFDKPNEYNELKKILTDYKGFIITCKDTNYMLKKLNDLKKLTELQKLFQEIEPHDYSKVSNAGVGLKEWVGASLLYMQTYRQTKPAMDKVQIKGEELARMEANLFEKTKNLNEKEAELGVLQDNYDKSKEEQFTLQTKMTNIEIKLKRANRLVDGLKDEEKRWKENIKGLQDEELNLMSNVILSSAVLGYFV